MPLVTYKSGLAFLDSVSLKSLAKKYGSPLFAYSKKNITERCRTLLKAFSNHPTLACYALKANSNLSLLNIIFSEGLGADVVSGGEFKKALVAGLPSNKIIFSGVGKTKNEISTGIKNGLFSFNVESLEELSFIAALAKQEKSRVRISLRINPNINVKTNPYIATGLYKTKFGIPESQIKEALELMRSFPELSLVGLSCHLGSQIKNISPYAQASKRLVHIADNLRAHNYPIEFLDLGGGFGVSYEGKKTPSITEYANAIQKPLKGKPYLLVVEPGRWIVAESGILVSEILYVKSNPHKKFFIIDASMTELIRPALYGAYHPIEVCEKRRGIQELVDVVGPVCETSDFLGLKRKLSPAKTGDYLWIGFCGAYGASMSSQYNMRPKAAEVLVDGDSVIVIRQRENLEDL
ncbi:MAG: diaminopimelate decarboxylase, partial [Pseudomonadota bacterium]